MVTAEEKNKKGSGYLRLAILWLGILLLGSFWLSVRGSSEPAIMTVVPQAPRQGEPIVATIKMNNPSPVNLFTGYQFYVNGVLLQAGDTTLAPYSSKVYQYVYENTLPMGEQLNFVVRTQSNQGSFEKILSTPPYPPQIWSSFVSFASFSTSLISSMSTMSFYQVNFAADTGLNVGIVASVVLIGVLIFLELPLATVRGKTITVAGRLRIRFTTMAWILLIIFMGMVYTKIAMIITA